VAAQAASGSLPWSLAPRGLLRGRSLLVWAAIAGLIAWSWRGTRFDLVGLLSADGAGQMLAYVRKLFPPDLSADFLGKVVYWSLETFAISLMGTLFSVAIALLLVFPASRTLAVSGLLFERDESGRPLRALRIGCFLGARAALNLLRTVPHIVWALLFVFAVGLGPFPGVLALGLHTGGVLEALQATGASRLQIFVYGILPRVAPQLLAYSLYRWEVNIREAVILGYVGAGGLGQQIQIAISLFLEQKLLTLILAIYLMVTLVDYLSACLRRRLL